MTERKEDRSLGELFAALASETSTLVRQEVELAKTEMTQKATRVGRDVGTIGAGGAIAYAGFLVFLAAVVLGLGQLIPLWVSALLVGILVIIVGFVVVQTGLGALKRANLTPRETIQTLKEDAEWAKEQTK